MTAETCTRATCPGCGRVVAITPLGRVWPHDPLAGSDAQRCPAAGKPFAVATTNAETAAQTITRMQAEINDLRALVSTCICPSWPPEGPSEECPVHGAVRAFNDATAEIAAMRPVVGAAIALVQTWKLVRSVLVDGTAPAALRDAVNVFTDHGTTSGWARTTPEALGAGDDVPEPTPAPQKTAQPGFVAADCITAERRVIEAAKAWRSMGTHYNPPAPADQALDYAVDLLRSLDPGGYSVIVGPDPLAAPPKATQSEAELLTADEHRAMELTGELAGLLSSKIVADGRSREGDRRELMYQLHAIQNAIGAQAAARAYPDRYRLLGADDPGKSRGCIVSYDPDFRWQYGPTETDPRPGAMWHVGCGGEVTYVEDVPGCATCGQEGPPLIHLDGSEIYSWGPVSHSPWPLGISPEPINKGRA